jgi:hypothetical protein
MDITLNKLKYRNPNKRIRPALSGEPAGLITYIYKAGTFKSKSSNSKIPGNERPSQGTGHRRRQGLGAIGG